MSNLNRHPVRRTAAGVLAGALAFSGAFAAGTPAFAAVGFSLDRVAGADRYATSAAIAAEFGAADGAILASGETGRSVDALAASFLAGIRQDPVLLTARDAVPASVLARLNALTSKNVTIVGGTAAVSTAVETQLRAAGFTVTRLGGRDRFETAELVVKAGTAEGDESKIGLLASGLSPVDALAGGPLAYKNRHPIFLTAGATLPQDTIDAMVAAGTTSVIILGGTTVVPASIETQLAARGITVVTRLGGADRSATSRLIADYLIANAGFTATTFNVASGANQGVDALSGAALSGKENRVLLVTNTATDPGSVDDFATARQATLTAAGDIFGGVAVVSAAIETALEAAGVGTAAPSGTVRPELVSASITGTVVAGTETAANPVGTSVRYSFDEVVVAPVAANFRVYTAAGVPTAATAVTLEAGGRSVVARFAGLNTTTLAGGITVATIDAGAVDDLEGNDSTEGDAAIGTAVAAGGAGALPAGITAAPDLLTVGNFRSAAQDTQTAVDFTFDEAATLVGADVTGFSLVLQDGSVVQARPVAELPFGSTSGGTAQGGNGTTTFTLVFNNPAGSNTDIAGSGVGRGIVAANTVRDTATPTNANVAQAADATGGGTTLQADLVSVSFRPSADTTADQVLFDFDQNISGVPAAGAFTVYRTDGTIATGTGTPVVNTADNSQVLVNFADEALVGAVGGQVTAGSVTAASGSGTNQFDEEGAAGTAAASSGQTPGLTTGPDLTSVALATTTDAFGNVSNFAATYTFDEDVAGTVGGGGAPVATGEFFLYLANGTRLVADACTIGTTEATDNTVVCTGFDVTTGGGTQATNAQVGSATLGTVDDGAVTGTGSATTISGASDAVGNPEGAALTTGGTGTRTS